MFGGGEKEDEGSSWFPKMPTIPLFSDEEKKSSEDEEKRGEGCTSSGTLNCVIEF